MPKVGQSLADSSEQRRAETYLVDAFSRELRVALAKKRLPAGTSAIEFDGVSDDALIVVEAWAHVGPAKPAQRHKVMTDALKLVWACGRLVPQNAKRFLLFGDEKAADSFRGAGWMAMALKDLEVTIKVIDLSPDLRRELELAQRRQDRYGIAR